VVPTCQTVRRSLHTDAGTSLTLLARVAKHARGLLVDNHWHSVFQSPVGEVDMLTHVRPFPHRGDLCNTVYMERGGEK
jgi:hypothetical protein